MTDYQTIYRVVIGDSWTEFASEADAQAWRDANAPGAPVAVIERALPEPERWRVSKDTLLVRVEAAGKLAEVIAAIDAMPADEQFLWTNFAWFWSDNERIRAMCQVLGLDPEVIMAEDDYL